MLLETSTTFKQINYTPSGGNAQYQSALIDKHKIVSFDTIVYTITFEGLVKEGNIWYKFTIEHRHDFSKFEQALIQREIDKTVNIQKNILEFYQQNLLDFLDNPSI